MFHNIDKTPEESAASKKVSAAMRILKTKLNEHSVNEDDFKKVLSGDWNIGTIHLGASPDAFGLRFFTSPEE